jgi:hypothetical protein
MKSNMFLASRRDWFVLAVITLLSAAWATFLLGFVRIDPTSTSWLNVGDVAQHYLGWHFFRGEPWTIPFGMNTRYGLDMGSSIVFTDSIPLLAIPLKIIDRWLPQHFQYAGAWMVLCFIMQGLSAFLLLRLFTVNVVVLLAGASLFVLSPALVSRSLGHFALMSQWIILLSLWLYFSPYSVRNYGWPWRCLLVVAALIHGYLLYFVLAIWLATLLRDASERNATRVTIAGQAIISIVVLACAMWLVGWFSMPFDAAAFGVSYGQYAANLASLINPVWSSPLLPTIALSPSTGSVESMNYVGAGIIALSIIAMGLLLQSGQAGSLVTKHRWLLLIALALSLLAFSPKMYWGELLLVQIYVPQALLNKLEFIRASGRLLWLLHYLIILSAVVLTVKFASTKIASALVLAALGLQLYDLRSSYINYADHLSRAAATAAVDAKAASLKSSFWALAAKRYTEVNFVPITHMPPRYEPIALWAGDHHIAINAAYFGRIPVSRAFTRNPTLIGELTTGTRRTHTLYIIQNEQDLDRLVLQENDGVGVVDGYRIVAPAWFAFFPEAGDQIELSRPRSVVKSPGSKQ